MEPDLDEFPKGLNTGKGDPKEVDSVPEPLRLKLPEMHEGHPPEVEKGNKESTLTEDRTLLGGPYSCTHSHRTIGRRDVVTRRKGSRFTLWIDFRRKEGVSPVDDDVRGRMSAEHRSLRFPSSGNRHRRTRSYKTSFRRWTSTDVSSNRKKTLRTSLPPVSVPCRNGGMSKGIQTRDGHDGT